MPVVLRSYLVAASGIDQAARAGRAAIIVCSSGLSSAVTSCICCAYIGSARIAACRLHDAATFARCAAILLSNWLLLRR